MTLSEFVIILRDLLIIFLAIENMVLTALIAIMIWQIYRLSRMIYTEVIPILRDTQDTITTVRGTTTFMSENLAQPVIRNTGRVARARRTAQVLMAGLGGSSGKPKTMPTPAGTAIPPAPMPAPPPVASPPAGNGSVL
jgi:hypothetical protein